MSSQEIPAPNSPRYARAMQLFGLIFALIRDSSASAGAQAPTVQTPQDQEAGMSPRATSNTSWDNDETMDFSAPPPQFAARTTAAARASSPAAARASSPAAARASSPAAARASSPPAARASSPAAARASSPAAARASSPPAARASSPAAARASSYANAASASGSDSGFTPVVRTTRTKPVARTVKSGQILTTINAVLDGRRMSEFLKEMSIIRSGLRVGKFKMDGEYALVATSDPNIYILAWNNEDGTYDTNINGEIKWRRNVFSEIFVQVEEAVYSAIFDENTNDQTEDNTSDLIIVYVEENNDDSDFKEKFTVCVYKRQY